MDYHVEITPETVSRHYFRDVWRSRELIAMFAWRDLVLRYKQTTVGILWVLIRPLLTMAIFAVVFGKFLKVPGGDVPYPVLILSGLVPWQLFTSVLSGVSESLFAQSAVLSKVYFPRLIVPISALIVNLVDALVALLLLMAFMGYFGVSLSPRLVLLPIALVLALPAAFGLGLWFAAVAAKYRDFRNIVPFLVMISLYASPVAFTDDVVPDSWKVAYWLNPIVGVIAFWRWVLFGTEIRAPAEAVFGSAAISVGLLILGFRYFRRQERAVVDVI